jgi:hypothetical protein
MPRNGQETALEWLSRVSRESNDSNIIILADFAVSQWIDLSESWKARDVKTRRSLWDLMAGIEQIGHNTIHKTTMSTIYSGPSVFNFPIFLEACHYRGKEPPVGAVETGVRVHSHRRPQTTKWGNIVLKS